MKLFFNILIAAFLMISLAACERKVELHAMNANINELNPNNTVILGAGCFWCVEAVFQNLNGVTSVESGYSGGTKPNPTYQEVCSGNSGYAEVCKITFNPEIITFDELLEVFWLTHDPTTLNRQGNDVGTQYRSVIFYLNEKQKIAAEKYKRELNSSSAFSADIVTEISPLHNYYKAEDYHQNYYNDNKNQPYCSFVIQPKLEKFKKAFANKTKK